jgi:hypothetical protein
MYLESLRAAFESVSLPHSNKRIQFQEWLEDIFITQATLSQKEGQVCS